MIELEERRLLSNYVVNDQSDIPLAPGKGPGKTQNETITLRSAIEQVDLDGGGSITFARAMTIVTTGDLVVSAPDVTINGGTQGSVVLEGSGVVNDAIDLSAGGAVIKGLEFHDFQGAGIGIQSASNVIENCILSADDEGVMINGGLGDASDNLIAGNLIGTDPLGTSDQGNTVSGIEIMNGTGTTIGGTSTAARNIISGNSGTGLADGIWIQGDDSTENLIEGNWIGLDSTGLTALGNSGAGNRHQRRIEQHHWRDDPWRGECHCRRCSGCLCSDIRE